MLKPLCYFSMPKLIIFFKTRGFMRYHFLMILLLSCSSIKKEDRLLAWETWKGKSVTDIEKQHYFKNLTVVKIKHEEGLETWILRDQTQIQTGSYCQSLGGCLGMPTYNCDNAFSVKDGVILSFEQNGSCPGIKTIEAPKK